MRARRTARKLEATAHHEAGHAVASVALGLPLRYVPIRPDPEDGNLGHAARRATEPGFRPDIELPPAQRDRLERMCVAIFAGAEAERRFRGLRGPARYDHGAARHDYRQAVDLASYVEFERATLEPYLAYLRARARAFVEAPRAWRAPPRRG